MSEQPSKPLLDDAEPKTQIPEDPIYEHPNSDGETDEHLLLEIIRVRSQEKQKRALQLFRRPNEQLEDFFMNYQLFDGLGLQMKDLLMSKSLKLVKNDTRIYFGEINEQKKHGVGITIYQDGRIYEGQFSNNEKNGFGYEIYPNCNVYVGDFDKNKKHGRGSFYWFTVNNLAPTNHEEIEYYRGEWWGGLPCGRGVHKQANGDVCQGIFKNGLKHGEGYQKFSNGDSYKGEYVNGLPQGYGEYVWSDGSNYKGDFKQGVRNGFGIWKKSDSKNSESYRGHYLLDRKCGYGIYIWENGDYYKGEFFQDARHGYGEFYSNNSLVYKGAWENGKEAPHLKLTKKKHGEMEHYKNRNNITIVDLSQGDILHENGGGTSGKARSKDYKYYREANFEVIPQTTLKKKPRKLQTHNPQIQKSETRKHGGRIGHRNCIPVQQFGMPRHMYRMNKQY